MKVKIFPIVSSLHEKNRISEETKILLDDLMNSSKYQFEICDIDEIYDGDLPLILIQSGGSEQLFLDNLSKLRAPYYLLTYGNNNSLAASLEILSYIKDNNLDGEVIHGSTEYIIDRIHKLTHKKTYRFGVIGKPSDWLIASHVNYDDALKLHNIELIDIDIKEVEANFEAVDESLIVVDKLFDYDENEVRNALKLHSALEKIKAKYNLDGLTIRCFDLLGSLKTTACLSLALFNSFASPSSCEGDIPTLVSMHVLRKVTGSVGFQANPSRINVNESKMVLAHCTLPLNMVKSFSLDTHFESGIGVAVKGELKEEPITIFKLSRNLKDYYVSEGKIIRNLYETNLCRTQIEISVDDNIEYFLNRPYGNHHVVVYGNHKKEIEEYMSKLLK